MWVETLIYIFSVNVFLPPPSSSLIASPHDLMTFIRLFLSSIRTTLNPQRIGHVPPLMLLS